MTYTQTVTSAITHYLTVIACAHIVEKEMNVNVHCLMLQLEDDNEANSTFTIQCSGDRLKNG